MGAGPGKRKGKQSTAATTTRGSCVLLICMFGAAHYTLRRYFVPFSSLYVALLLAKQTMLRMLYRLVSSVYLRHRGDTQASPAFRRYVKLIPSAPLALRPRQHQIALRYQRRTPAFSRSSRTRSSTSTSASLRAACARCSATRASRIHTPSEWTRSIPAATCRRSRDAAHVHGSRRYVVGIG